MKRFSERFADTNFRSPDTLQKFPVTSSRGIARRNGKLQARHVSSLDQTGRHLLTLRYSGRDPGVGILGLKLKVA